MRLFLAAFMLFASLANANTFVHMFEHRWTDIGLECKNYLSKAGYSAVLVSPPQEHALGNTWWTRYQPVKHWVSTSRSGTREQFAQMVKDCNTAGVDVYVDTVINHVARLRGFGTAGSPYDFELLTYPQYEPNDFHKPCTIQDSDYSNNAWAVRNCSFTRLPDLKTESPKVQAILAAYLSDMQAMGVKGFRIDAAKHIPPQDLLAILAKLKTEPYVFQEVLDHGGESTSASEYLPIGDVTEVRYSSTVSYHFTKGGIEKLLDIKDRGWIASDKAVVFIDNHDRQRIGHGGDDYVPTYKNSDIYDLAVTFMLAYPYGYPMLLSGYAFTDNEVGPPDVPLYSESQLNCWGSTWQCEHRRHVVAAMIKFKNSTQANFYMTDVHRQPNVVAFGRGHLGHVVINRSRSDVTLTLNTQMAPGEYCDTWQPGCNKVVVNNDRTMRVKVRSMTALAITK